MQRHPNQLVIRVDLTCLHVLFVDVQLTAVDEVIADVFVLLVVWKLLEDVSQRWFVENACLDYIQIVDEVFYVLWFGTVLL